MSWDATLRAQIAYDVVETSARDLSAMFTEDTPLVRSGGADPEFVGACVRAFPRGVVLASQRAAPCCPCGARAERKWCAGCARARQRSATRAWKAKHRRRCAERGCYRDCRKGMTLCTLHLS